MRESQQLLAEYARNGSEPAFRELVGRYVDLVYSAAFRLVNQDAHLAEDVTQTVFADLARHARTLPSGVMLGGWLHRHTCFVASKTMRGERRRRERERQAVEKDAQPDHDAANLAALTPALDEAIEQLGAEDRAAIVLRFFERKDYKAVGAALGSNEEAARKRVDRALGKLHGLLGARGVTLSAAALAASLGTQIIQAAPAGLAASVSTSALALAAQGTTQALGILAMSKIKAGIVGAVALAIVTTPWVLQYRSNTLLRGENDALRRQHSQDAERWAAESTRLSNQLAKAAAPQASRGEDAAREVLKLRGEVARLRQENGRAAADAKSTPSAMSGLTSNPESRKVIRNQQKMGMAAIFAGFGKQAGLSKEIGEQLNDLLADHVMENIDHVTAGLKGSHTAEEMEAAFAAQEAALKGKVQALVGPEAGAKFDEYSRDLASYLTGEQFKGMLGGDKEKKDQVARQLSEWMKEETRQALAQAGLSPDYQTVPTLNFRNFASEAEAERNLKLLGGIYEKVAGRAGSFLSPEESAKFAEFCALAIANNKAALQLNRQLMAPGTK